jgi:hypothetical protein
MKLPGYKAYFIMFCFQRCTADKFLLSLNLLLKTTAIAQMGGKILLWWGSPQKIGRNSGNKLL